MRCGGEIPHTKRIDAKYCSERCKDAAEKLRYCRRNPAYVQRQRALVTKLKHLALHGHTDFITNPIGNIKDKYRVARSLGYRSMLEVSVANQLKEAGIPFMYEAVTIHYVKPVEAESDC